MYGQHKEQRAFSSKHHLAQTIHPTNKTLRFVMLFATATSNQSNSRTVQLLEFSNSQSSGY